MKNPSGKVYLLGAGPGDPDLLTIKALRVLRRAGVVLYDRLVTAEILALANPSAEFLYAGKSEGEQDATQSWIERVMLDRATQGLVVARVKGGDPFIFGRGAEERAFLESQGIEVEIVPGVSSALAAPAAAGIPLTLRSLSRSFTVVTGHCESSASTDWGRLGGADTIVVLMGVARRAGIARELIAAGRSPGEPAAFVESATTASQRVIRTSLGEIATGSVEVASPAVLVVGAVAALARGEQQPRQEDSFPDAAPAGAEAACSVR